MVVLEHTPFLPCPHTFCLFVSTFFLWLCSSTLHYTFNKWLLQLKLECHHMLLYCYNVLPLHWRLPLLTARLHLLTLSMAPLLPLSLRILCHPVALDLILTKSELLENNPLRPPLHLFLTHLTRNKAPPPPLTSRHLHLMTPVSTQVPCLLTSSHFLFSAPELDYNYIPWGATKSLTLLCPPDGEPHVAIAELVDKV